MFRQIHQLPLFCLFLPIAIEPGFKNCEGFFLFIANQQAWDRCLFHLSVNFQIFVVFFCGFQIYILTASEHPRIHTMEIFSSKSSRGVTHCICNCSVSNANTNIVKSCLPSNDGQVSVQRHRKAA